MENSYIPRTLWFTENNQPKEISQAELFTETRSLVILGEAGMGKTQLLKSLGKHPDYAYCTAKQLIRKARPEELLGDDAVLVIDALDEAPSHQENDAIDEVLRKLDGQRCPRFILSCRVAEWRSATAVSNITETYDQAPLQLHLKPFSRDEIELFLTQKVGSKRSGEVLEHFENLGLSDWLGNPQTLDLISTVSLQEALPRTRSELFDIALKSLVVEHNEIKAEHQLSEVAALTAAGAACAALILCDQTAVVRKAAARLIDGELLLQKLHQLPGAGPLDQVLNTRLLIASAPDQFTYMHRRIAEYLAARWLAGLANTDRKRRLLIRMFQHQGLTPASLRGTYAWLAHDPKLAPLIIQSDPTALLEYGEVDHLSANQARLLLKSLESLEFKNPRQLQPHSWKARCFAQAELLADVQHWLGRTDNQFVRLRVLVIESLEGTEMASLAKAALIEIASNPDEFYITRSAAFSTVAPLLTRTDVDQLLGHLLSENTEDSLRLALKIAQNKGFESIDAKLLSQISLAYAATDSNMAGKFFFLERELAIEQIEKFLDNLVEGIGPSDYGELRFSTDDLTNLVFRLLSRAIKAEKISATQFLRWIQPLSESNAYPDERQQLATELQNNSPLRHSIQHEFFLTNCGSENNYLNHYELARHSSALNFSETDIVALLDRLPIDHEHWRKAVLICHHRDGHGAAVRQAAQRFAQTSNESQAWILRLTEPAPPQDWEIEQAERKQKREAKAAQEKLEALAWYAENKEKLLCGDWLFNWIPAHIYLGQHINAKKEAPAEERIGQFLSPEISQVALLGFEAHLTLQEPKPTAMDIAKSFTDKSINRAVYIIAAAMLERIRIGRGLQDLSDDRIMAGFFLLELGVIHEHTNPPVVQLKSALIQQIKSRGLLDTTLHLLYEPMMIANLDYVPSLQNFLQSESFAAVSANHAKDWLKRFPDLHINTEKQLIDCLTRSHHYEVIKQIASSRVSDNDSIERKLTWEAVRLLTDFEATAKRLEAQALEPELLWSLQERSLGDRYPRTANTRFPWSHAQLAWIFRRFRLLWPLSSHPRGISSGSKNPWDASKYLGSLAEQLANQITPEAISALQELRDGPEDGYTELLQSLCAEQLRKSCEQSYKPLSIEQLTSFVNDQAPLTPKQLQSWVMEELEIVQAKIRANDVDSWRNFYNDDLIPRDEEYCRDRLLELLRYDQAVVHYEPESHVAADKEVDIGCRVGSDIFLPIEIKGQWHREVWTAADTQLNRLYASDWRAQGFGIYLVLWFGPQPGGKALQSAGRGVAPPQTPIEMKDMLIAKSAAAQNGNVSIFVMDITIPDSAKSKAVSKS